MKTTPYQLSIFDIMLDEKGEQHEQQIVQPPVRKQSQGSDCPYQIPTITEIISDIQKMSGKYGNARIFTDTVECGALAISNAIDLQQKDEREKRYMEIIHRYTADEQQAIVRLFSKMFALLSSVVYDNGRFADNLGEIYSQLNLCADKKGQVFTPFHIAHFMALAAIGDDVKQKCENDGVITIADPCCGAGVMSLGALDVLKNNYGVNYTRNCYFQCSDIDIHCVHMTYLQLSLAGASAVVIHQNSLTNETWSVWRTPAYLLQYYHFNNKLKNNKGE